jgi:uncharacterized protein (TIGR02611 family)
MNNSPRFRLKESVKKPIRSVLQAAHTIIVVVIGSTIVLFGLVLLFLPGPGLALVIAGLAVLASEFAWARRLLQKARKDLEKGINEIRK